MLVRVIFCYEFDTQTIERGKNQRKSRKPPKLLNNILKKVYCERFLLLINIYPGIFAFVIMFNNKQLVIIRK